MHRLLRSLLAATLVGAVTALPGGAQSQPGDGCPNLAGQTVAAEDIGSPSEGATITSAQLVSATPQGSGPNGSVVPEKPAYCEVQGTIASLDPAAPPITFQLNLPSTGTARPCSTAGAGSTGC